LLNAKVGEWSVHHVDHDRTHNERSNWRLLCGRCHAREHKRWKTFPNRKPMTPATAATSAKEAA
jgi:5-methylcytosine-specific restriction endonuclease McrA